MSVAAGRHRRPATPVWRGAAVVLAWLAVVGAAPWQQLPDRAYDLALFVHLASVIVGLGAVLLVDWTGLLWLARRRTLTDVMRTAQSAHVPTWLGFTGLLASGLFLGTPADLKAVAVLVVGLNGVYAGRLLPQLSRPAPPPQLLARAATSAAISQIGWWTAAVLGFLNGLPR